ncbi:MAG: site-specific integrase [Pirellulales bacterium]
MPEPNRRTRSATRPVPENVRSQFYLAVWDLAWSGHFYRHRPELAGAFLDRFGSGSILARRHGLTILWLTAMAGRFNELATLLARDVDGCTVAVHRSKGGAQHVVTVDVELLQCTTAWHNRVAAIAAGKYPASRRVRRWASAIAGSTYLLPANNGRSINVNVFNRDVMGPLGQLFGFKLSSHCCRDTACQEAMRLVKRDAALDSRPVQALLGHRSIRTTEKYLSKQQSEQLCLPLHELG